uniref:Uncharacterized protein n=1 Tax=Astyanax mexicanus TaxID=7994 RepID=A0A8B9GX40_ASTMX
AWRSTEKDMASQLREARVNYWVFEFYISKAFEAFRNEEYDSYVQFRNLVQGECCVVTLNTSKMSRVLFCITRKSLQLTHSCSMFTLHCFKATFSSTCHK